jgi:hypothetical protein
VLAPSATKTEDGVYLIIYINDLAEKSRFRRIHQKALLRRGSAQMTLRASSKNVTPSCSQRAKANVNNHLTSFEPTGAFMMPEIVRTAIGENIGDNTRSFSEEDE